MLAMTASNADFPGVVHVKTPERSAESDVAPVESLVSEIVSAVRAEGDAAVKRFSLRFDKVDLAGFEVTPDERKAAVDALDPQMRADTEFAIANVRSFSEAQFATILPLLWPILPRATVLATASSPSSGSVAMFPEGGIRFSPHRS